jgi:transcriptional regulator with XRE-family HTH domain
MAATAKPIRKFHAGQRLRNEREAIGLSQADVARFHPGGMSESGLKRIENQRNLAEQVQADFMQAIAGAVAARNAAAMVARSTYERFAELLPAMPNLPDCSGYLATCSPVSLQAFALRRMSEVSDRLNN